MNVADNNMVERSPQAVVTICDRQYVAILDGVQWLKTVVAVSFQTTPKQPDNVKFHVNSA